MAAAIHERAYGALVKDFRVGMRENDVQNIVAGVIYGVGAEYQEGGCSIREIEETPEALTGRTSLFGPRISVSGVLSHYVLRV